MENVGKAKKRSGAKPPPPSSVIDLPQEDREETENLKEVFEKGMCKLHNTLEKKKEEKKQTPDTFCSVTTAKGTQCTYKASINNMCSIHNKKEKSPQNAGRPESTRGFAVECRQIS